MSEEEKVAGFTKVAADRMAAAIDVLVHQKKLGARSIVADARLDYGDPLTREEAERIIFGANEIRTEGPPKPHETVIQGKGRKDVGQ